jgi:transcriptional regulator with XRE-family HTH domain
MAPYESRDLARCFGENVLLTRRLADLSQEELGFLASLHRTEIGQLERGVRLARIDTVVKLAGALEVPPGDLLKGMAWKPSRAPNGKFITRAPAKRRKG